MEPPGEEGDAAHVAHVEHEQDAETHDTPCIDISPVAVVAPPPAAAQRNVAILLGAVALTAVSKLAVPRLLRLLSHPNAPAAASPFVCSLDLRAGEGKALANTTFALCDLFAVEGQITSFGCTEFGATQATSSFTAPAVIKCLSAGGRCIAKTVMDELSLGLTGHNVRHPLRNPAGASYVVGGSASGSAVAVAQRLVDFSLGSDVIGNVRLPAACCGLFALRPTLHKVSTRGMQTLAKDLDTVAVQARTAGMLRKAGDVLLRLSDPGRIRRPTKVLFAEDVVVVCATDVRDAVAAMKRAVEKIPANAGRATPEVGTVHLGDYLYRKCASLAEFTPQTQAGTAIKSDMPALSALAEAMRVMHGCNLWTSYGAWLEKARPRLGPHAAAMASDAASLHRHLASDPRSKALEKAIKLMAEVRVAMGDLLRNGVVLCLPTTMAVPPRTNASTEVVQQWIASSLVMLSVSSVSSCPQVTMPVKLGRMPVGVSLLAAQGDDQLLLHTAMLLEPILAATQSAPPGSAERTKFDAVQAKEKGNAAYAQAKYDEAVEQYSEAIEQDPSMVSAFNNRAMSYLKLGHFHLTEADCNAALKLDPSNAKALLRRGTARAMQAMFTEAMADFEAVLVLEPTNKAAKQEIGRLRKMVAQAD